MVYVVIEYERSTINRILGVVDNPFVWRKVVAEHNNKYPDHPIVETLEDRMWEYQHGWMYWQLQPVEDMNKVKTPITD